MPFVHRLSALGRSHPGTLVQASVAFCVGGARAREVAAAPSGHAHRPFKSRWIVWGVRFGGISFILDAETEHERGPVVMAEDYQQKYVGMVAAVIGGVVLFLGLVGLIVNLS